MPRCQNRLGFPIISGFIHAEPRAVALSFASLDKGFTAPEVFCELWATLGRDDMKQTAGADCT